MERAERKVVQVKSRLETYYKARSFNFYHRLSFDECPLMLGFMGNCITTSQDILNKYISKIKVASISNLNKEA